MELLFHLRYSKRDRARGTIYCRCTVDGVRAPEKSLNIKVVADHFDKKRQMMLVMNENSQLHNARLNKVRADFDEAYLELRKGGAPVTAMRLIEIVFGGKKTLGRLSGAFEAYVEEKKTTTFLAKGTITNYHKFYKKLVKHLGDMLLADMTDDKFLKLIRVLKSEDSNDYAMKIAQFLRSIMDFAVAKGELLHNPTKRIVLTRKNEHDTSHLTPDELARLIAFDFCALEIHAETKRVLSEERDAFVFCCYTGLHHVDYSMRDFETFEHNGKTWLSGFRKKSAGGKQDKPYQMPLHPVALAIIAKYGGIDKLPIRSNPKRNLYLKNIAAFLGFKILLSTKIARKTFANYCLNVLRMRAETVAALLGHKSLSSIKHYARITNLSVEAEMVFG